MRTFLTYVLAALVAALVLSGPEFMSALTSGDPRLVAGGLAAAMVGFLIDLLVAFHVFGLVWLIASSLFKRFGHEVRKMGNLFLGAAVYALPPMVFFVLSRLTTVETGSGPNFIPFSDPGFLVALATTVLAGAAWGTVFWIRAPKPTTAGIAA